jgi:hypothetical protein
MQMTEKVIYNVNRDDIICLCRPLDGDYAGYVYWPGEDKYERSITADIQEAKEDKFFQGPRWTGFALAGYLEKFGWKRITPSVCIDV